MTFEETLGYSSKMLLILDRALTRKKPMPNEQKQQQHRLWKTRKYIELLVMRC